MVYGTQTSEWLLYGLEQRSVLAQRAAGSQASPILFCSWKGSQAFALGAAQGTVSEHDR